MSKILVVAKRLLLIIIFIIAVLAFPGLKKWGSYQARDVQAYPGTGPDSAPAFGPAFQGPADIDLQVTPGPPDFSISKAQVGPPVPPASFDKDLRSLPQTGPAEKRPVPEIESPFRVKGLPSNVPDEVAQTSMGTLNMPTPNNSFNGLDL